MPSVAEQIRRCWIAFLLCALLASGAASGTPQPRSVSWAASAAPVTLSDSLSPKDRVEVFEEVWKTIDERYYNPSFNGIDWRAVRDRYRPMVESATTDEEFYRLLKRMVGELHDAHTRFHTPEERRERERLQAVSAGVSIYEVEGKPVVVGVEPGSDAARAEVEEGMLVLAIDGKATAERLDEARSRVAGSSTDRAVRLRIYRMIIDGDPGTTLQMKLARADGSTLDVTLTRRVVPDAAVVIWRRLESGVGYIKLTLWKSPVRKQFKKALRQLKDASGLVVDIRGNPGGEAEEVADIASYFFNSHVPFGKFSSRAGKTVYLRTDDGHLMYSGPIAVLVNEGSGSGSELFAGVMQENTRAIVVGRQTCGCVLGISKFRKLKGGGELAVSEYGYQSPGGKTFEGSGVIPNKEVELRIADLRKHRDAALEEAEKLLSRDKLATASNGAGSRVNAPAFQEQAKKKP